MRRAGQERRSAREIERKVRETYRKGLRDAEKREPPTDIERAWREVNERGRSATRVSIRLPQPQGPERGGGGFER